MRKLSVIACVALTAAFSALAVGLHISQQSGQIAVAWPTQAVNFTLESTTNLAGEVAWQKVAEATAVVGTNHVVTLPTPEVTRFFRLRKASGASPVIANVQAPASLALEGSTFATFDYVDAECDVAFVELTRSNALESVTENIPAAWLGLTNVSGLAALPLSGRNMPFGTNTFTVRLKDRLGNVSAPMVFQIVLGGSGAGGTAPIVTHLANVSGAVSRPVGPRDRARAQFVYGYFDPDGDIERLRFRITHPTGRIETVEVTATSHRVMGTNGVVQTPLLVFRSTNAPGIYSVELTAIDRNGNFGNTASSFARLFGPPSALPLRLTGFSPTQGVAGAVVTLTGTGFITNSVASNQVSLADIACEATAVTATNLTVVVPEGAGTGKFVVRNSRGLALNTNFFHVPASVTISPSSPQVHAGSSEPFSAAVVSAPSTLVAWRVNDIPGGNPLVGTISSDGLYVAPAEVPPGGVVTVSAAVSSNPLIVGQTTVTILPPPLTPGLAMVHRAFGGTVRSTDGAAMVAIPPGALPCNTNISVTVLRGTNVPPPETGTFHLAAAEFGPSGLIFDEPVTITLPLARYHPPGTTLPLRWFNPANRTYVDEGILATVGGNGEQASAAVSHFSTFTIPGGFVGGASINPTITAITPAGGQEGMKIPVWLTGSDLTADLIPMILTNGVPTDDIIPGPLHARTNQAGLLLHIQTIPNLAEGESRIYTLRLSVPFLPVFVETDFTVSGLDELDLRQSEVRLMTPADNRRYSRVTVPGPRTIPVPPPLGQVTLPASRMVSPFSDELNLEVTGPVTIDGNLLANGNRGRNGERQQGGQQGPSPNYGGAGGLGREDNGTFLSLEFLDDGFDHAEPLNFGGDGNLAKRELRFPEGVGGDPGVNINLFDDLVELILAAYACLQSSGAACVELGVRTAADVFEIASSASDLAANNQVGKRGFVGVPGVGSVDGFGNGGGGGGGGGRFSVVLSGFQGGGGGAGGDGGRPVSIVSAQRISYDGEISTAGGDGGDGGTNVFNTVVFGEISVGFSGGGGGGGSGGRLMLTAADGVMQGTNGTASTKGGTNGFGGILVNDVSRFTLGKLVFRDDGIKRAVGGAFRRTGPEGFIHSSPVFIPTNSMAAAETDHKVTQRNFLRVRFHAGDLGTPGRTLRIVNDNGTTNDFLVIRGPDFVFTQPVLLKNGFNTLTVPGTFPLGMHPLLQKRILVLATDADGDGLSDADEAEFGSNPNDTDSDNDGLNDGQEALAGSDLLDPDSDDDGLGDLEEVNRGTSPVDADSDDDGFQDGAEVLLGANPLLASSVPEHIPSHVLFANSGGPGGAFLTVIDPATGRFGLLGRPNGPLGFGLAFDSLPALFVSRFSNLATHEPFGGATAPVGPFGGSICVTTIAYHPIEDRFYGVEEGPGPNFEPTGQLVEIDLYTGAATRIGVATNPIHALLFTADGTLLAALRGTPASDRFVKLDPRTGALTQEIGLIGVTPIFGLASTTGGVIYASHRLSNEESELLVIDPATGVGAPVANVRRAVFGLTSASFRSFSSIVSVNRFNTGTGNKGSGGGYITPDGRFAVFLSEATDLSSVTDTNGIVDAFVRDLEAGTTDLVSVNRFGTSVSASSGGAFMTGLSDDGRYVSLSSLDTNMVTLPKAASLWGTFRRDRLTGITVPVNVNGAGTAFGNAHALGGSMSANGRFITFDSQATDLANDNNGSIIDAFVRDMENGVTILVSVNRGGTGGGNSHSRSAVVSADGRYVAFNSRATDLVNVNDPNGTDDLFVRDLQTQTTVMVTVDPTGMNAANANAFASYLSPDGRFVLFFSSATNLTPLPDANYVEDIFVRDLQTGVTTLINTNLAGVPSGFYLPLYLAEFANGPGMSADGRYVVFHTTNNNMVSVADTNETVDVFVRDNQTGEIRLLSANHAGTSTGNAESYNPVISRDGRRVAFLSAATDLVATPPALNGFGVDVFVHDQITGTTTLLSYNHRRNGSATGDTGAGNASVGISGSGNVVTFTSGATNLVRIADTNRNADVFFRRMGP